MTHAPGAIFAEEAYALGKMLDHSAWQTDVRISRGITPSDVDMAVDNNGMILFCEISSQYEEWKKLREGQRRFYENCVKGGLHCAALCRHAVKLMDQRKIDTCNDIISFQLMFWDHGVVYSHVIAGNSYWQKFMLHWTGTSYGPLKLRRTILGKSVEQFEQIKEGVAAA